MGFTKNRSSLAETAALLILCALFFILAAASIATGVSAYTGASKLIDANNVYRTSLAYISNQVRRADVAGGVEVVSFGGVKALAINEPPFFDDDGNEYQYGTFIYCWDGWLRELYAEKGYELELEAGIEVMELDSIYFGVTANGQILAAVGHGDVSGYIMVTPRADGQWEVVLP